MNVLFLGDIHKVLLSKHRVHRGINPPQKYPPPLSCQASPLNLKTVQAPLFRQSSLCISFSWTLPPPKSPIFQWMPKMLKFLIVNPIFLLEVTKFLVKISQFEFLVMTEKNIFVYKLFCHEIFQILVHFFCKNCKPLKKITPLFSSNPLSKLKSCQAPPFWKFGRRFNPPQQKGWGAHYGQIR